MGEASGNMPELLELEMCLPVKEFKEFKEGKIMLKASFCSVCIYIPICGTNFLFYQTEVKNELMTDSI